MSKGNMLLGHARGKVGDLVFSRSNGEQIVRSRAAVVKNPQTEAQTIQRILLNTAAQAYSKLQAIVDHSFEGVQPGQKTMSKFMSKNLGMLRALVATAVANQDGFAGINGVVPIGYNGFATNSFIVSQGSMPEIIPYFEEGEDGYALLNIGGSSYQDVINTLGLQRGDQLTFGCVVGGGLNNTRFEYARVILDPRNADGSEALLSQPLIVDGAINLPSERNEGTFSVLTVSEQGVLSFNTAATALILGAFVIASRKGSDGNWKRSNATMVVGEYGQLQAISLEQALEMFQTGDIGTLNDRYLNNAGIGNIASVGAGNGTGLAFPQAHAADAPATANFTVVGVKSVVKGEVNYLKAVTSTGEEKFIACGNPNSTKYYRYLIDGGAADYSDTNGAEPDTAKIMVETLEQLQWMMAHGMTFEVAYLWGYVDGE